MRISDWSSDVCSSDLLGLHRDVERRLGVHRGERAVAQRDAPYFPDRRLDLLVGHSKEIQASNAEHQCGSDSTAPTPEKPPPWKPRAASGDRKSTRLNSSH